jgi:hypothetical protein
MLAVYMWRVDWALQAQLAVARATVPIGINLIITLEKPAI